MKHHESSKEDIINPDDFDFFSNFTKRTNKSQKRNKIDEIYNVLNNQEFVVAKEMVSEVASGKSDD